MALWNSLRVDSFLKYYQGEIDREMLFTSITHSLFSLFLLLFSSRCLDNEDLKEEDIGQIRSCSSL